jgi:hypothetical protein
MEHGKVIRGKTLGAWKKYAEEEYSNTPAQVLKYIIVLEEELSKLHQPTVSNRRELLIAYELKLWINPTQEQIEIAEQIVDMYLRN